MRFFCFLLLFFKLTVATTQNINLLTVDEGLPQSFVSSIEEDELGFIWIGTRNGLARYDGHEFKVFQHDPNKVNSLSSNFIGYIKKGKTNLLYIRHESGEIDIFDPVTEKIVHYLTKETILNDGIKTSKDNWHIDSNKNLWYIESSRKLVKYTFADAQNPSSKAYMYEGERIVDLFEDEDSNLWVLTSCCLASFDVENNKTFESDFDYPLNINNAQVEVVMHRRANGEIMWGDKERLYFFNIENMSFRYVKLPETSRFNIKWISSAPDGKDYFESNRNIYSYDDVLGLQLRAKIDFGEQREIRAFLVDASGLIWVGSNSEGIYLVDLTMNFESFTYKEDFLIDLLKEKFEFSADNLFGMDIKNRTGLSPAYYLRSKQTENGIWIALNRSVIYYDFTRSTFETLPDLEALPDVDSFSPIKGITLTDENYPLVIDQDKKLYLFDIQSQQWKELVASEALSKPEYRIVLPNDIILIENKLWVTTEASGLFKIDLLNNSVTNINTEFGLPISNLYGIVQDPKNSDLLWIASPQGLIKVSKETMSIKTFSTDEGLPDNVIYSIMPDYLGYLWLGTNRGLTRFHTTNYSLRTFTKSHGLPNLEFNRFHSLHLPNDYYAFGGISKGVVFNPRLIQEDSFEPEVVVTNIMINNSSTDEFLENRTFNTYAQLQLPYDKNTLSFEFSALQFSQPQDILYRYRLVGYDNDWVYIQNKREAIYTKIPPGKYTFEVNSTNTSGVWSPQIKSIAIKISPPYWSTWWARISYVLLAGFLVYLYIRYTIRQKLIKDKIELKNKEAESLRNLDEIKTNFFSNITHEIRTPLSLIIGPAELLLKGEEEPDKQKKLISVVHKNAENLLKLSSQLLDIAKLEAGVLKPQLLWGDVVSVVKKMAKAFTEEAYSKEVAIQLDTPQHAEYYFSPNTLERIVSNLISNALKFSFAGGEVKVILKCESEGITLVVKDNGKGIPQHELSNIFKRFYKAHTNGNLPGTGIGLSLVKELVDIHRGIITVESNEAKPSGTTFTVCLPFEKRAVYTEKSANDSNVNNNDSKIPIQTNGKPLLLIVEDNVELASFLSISLEKSYRVLLAKDGNEGLELATEHLPDIIVSDVLMEGMDGFEFCETLKKDINLNHIPTLLLTAKSDMNSKLKGLSLGADDYITKPFNVSELVMRIENKMELQAYQRDFFYKKYKLLPIQPENYVLENEHVNNDFLDRVQNIIDQYIEDEKFGVEDLASQLHMSRASLHRKIKSITSLSAGEIIKTYKLKRAITYLNQGLNVSETAYKTGFTSPSYFSKCFKETYHLTPTEYLQNQAVQQNL